MLLSNRGDEWEKKEKVWGGFLMISIVSSKQGVFSLGMMGFVTRIDGHSVG
jgi:hypothetical protein